MPLSSPLPLAGERNLRDQRNYARTNAGATFKLMFGSSLAVVVWAGLAASR
jgi:hypothetical protein